MEIRFINLSKYKMSKMPLRFYLPRFNKYWNSKIWEFTIFRDYGIEFDFRSHKSIIDMLLTPKEQRYFWTNWFAKRN